jgi:protein-S-isoprenylcysteine O-methyltransferase Ste14
MRILPPPVWVLVYIVIGVGVSYLFGWPRITGLPIIWLGILLIIGAGVLMAFAIRLFRREGTEIDPNSTTNRKLVTTGPYRFTRNPMYLGWAIVTLGVACLIGTWPMFVASIAFFATMNWVQIPFEEIKMRRQFGEAFDKYTREVRRWM